MKTKNLKQRSYEYSIAKVAAALIALAATSVSAAVIQSTFDTDLDGWTQDPAPGPGATLSWSSTGGNPGGYLRRGLGDGGGVSVLVAPSKFLGNRSAWNGGTFQWDGELISGNVGQTYNDGGSLAQPDYGTIRIDGGGLFATIDIVPGAPPNSWTNFSTPLTATAFGVSAATWSTILSNVTAIKFSIEAIYGSEEEGIDNIRMVPPPPRLSIATSAPFQAALSWSTNAAGFTLETTFALPASSWNAVTNVPVVLGSQFSVTVPATNAQQYFRLRQP